MNQNAPSRPVVIFTHGNLWYRFCHKCGAIVKHNERHGAIQGSRRGQCKSCWKTSITKPVHEMPEYTSWYSMKTRCYNQNRADYHRYGGRGITVCDTWINDFHKFYKDMGPRPTPRHTLDRIDVNGNYEPDNVRWATAQEQNDNQRRVKKYTYEGDTKTLAAWAKDDRCMTGRRSLYYRISVGVPFEEALTTVGYIGAARIAELKEKK